MFDPFKDFEINGYLRNSRKTKDANAVRNAEHGLFIANLQKALTFLSECRRLTYSDFLEVHRILFSNFYPWAGTDRLETAPESAISKAGVLFSHPRDARRAVEEGLRMAQVKGAMRTSPGTVMGLFAYGHPFLDGNGRTMLLVHAELCNRADFSIDWTKASKSGYLAALSREIERPSANALNDYLLQFVGPRLSREDLNQKLLAIKGLDGLDEGNVVEGTFDDASVSERYRQFDSNRGYELTGKTPKVTAAVCEKCGQDPCVCERKRPRMGRK